MMRLLVTGREGQVAQSLAERAKAIGEFDMVFAGRPGLDLLDPASVASTISAARPDAVINAAAYTAVDKAETEAETAFAVNRDGARSVAEAAERLGIPVIHLSTDFVFSGEKASAYVESDGTGPLSVYGQSKLEGELAVRQASSRAIILRTAWVYSPFGNNFVKTMLRIGKDRPVVRVVDDQWGNPTSALDIADAIFSIARQAAERADTTGTYHLTGTGDTTWCGFARHIFAASAKRGGPAPEVEAIPTSGYPTPAKRPANSQLDGSALKAAFGLALPAWQDSIEACVARLLTA